MSGVNLINIVPAFRFEIIQALRLLVSDQDDYAQIVRANQQVFVERWYDHFAPMRQLIDTAMAPVSYQLCYALLMADDTLAGMQECLRQLSAQLANGEEIEFIQRKDEKVWCDGVAALEKVLPVFYEECFKEEWRAWQPVLGKAAARMQQVLQGLNIFDVVEQFTGRKYGSLLAEIHPSESVRPGGFVLRRAGRMAMVLQYQNDLIWLLAGVIHESGHTLFRQPYWYEMSSLDDQDVRWLESLLPGNWRDTGYSEIRYYLEETFLEALAFIIAKQILPKQKEQIHQQAIENFRNRQLVLGPSIYQLTEDEYDPREFARYDDFLVRLIKERKIEVNLNT